MSATHQGRGRQQRQLRIIAGQWRGKRFRFPELDIRPTPDRVRETLFNWLQNRIQGAHCLDLYAGSGALGLEALSRGAGHVTFLELAPLALEAIKLNVAALKEGPRVSILRGDAVAPARAAQACSLVFLDPPYGKSIAPPTLKNLVAAGWIAADAIVVLEVGAKEEFAAPDGFTIEDERRYGAARLVLMRFRAA